MPANSFQYPSNRVVDRSSLSPHHASQLPSFQYPSNRVVDRSKLVLFDNRMAIERFSTLQIGSLIEALAKAGYRFIDRTRFSTLQIGSLIEAMMQCTSMYLTFRFSTLQIGSLIEASSRSARTAACSGFSTLQIGSLIEACRCWRHPPH